MAVEEKRPKKSKQKILTIQDIWYTSKSSELELRPLTLSHMAIEMLGLTVSQSENDNYDFVVT